MAELSAGQTPTRRQPHLSTETNTNHAANQVPGWSNAKNWVLCLLLALATAHCVQSIFLVNVSYLDLKAYDHGTERMPFQGRIAMMPLGRWAEGSHAMQNTAAWIELRFFHGRNRKLESYTPEKVAFLGAGICSTFAAVGFAVFFGRRHLPGMWWLPGALFLYMLYVTYAARCDTQYWYPYDLPHFALFGIAAVCVLQGWWLAAFCLFLLDVPVRETSVYLVPLMLVMGYARKRKAAFIYAGVMLLIWLPVHIAIDRHFAGNASDARIHYDFWGPALRNPYRWGQLASTFGFLAVPFCFGFKYLTNEERLFVYSALPAFASTALFGIWYETRVWDEWLLPAAALIGFQAVRFLSRSNAAELLMER